MKGRTLLASLGFSPEFILKRIARDGGVERLVMVGLWVEKQSWARVEDAFNSIKFFCGKVGVECVLERVVLGRGLISQLHSILRREASWRTVELFLTGGPRIVVVGFVVAGLMLDSRLQDRVEIVVWGEGFEGELRVRLSQLSKLILLDEVERRIVVKLAQSPGGLRPSEVLKELGIARSTFYKKVKRLIEAGIVIEDSGVYKLSPPILEIIK
ncbi:MAG: hypothetical protein F7B17_04800 [Desulfurococcales archaeon]|nr:hypothetical protein [Desulfurococcales archaeon]